MMDPKPAPASLQVSCVQMHWAKTLEFNLERTIHFIRKAASEGSRVVVFPETNLTGYYFPYVLEQPPGAVDSALSEVRQTAKSQQIWAIVGTLRKTPDRYLNLAHVIDPNGVIVHEYAKTHMAGRDEQLYCRPGTKLSLFEIDGVLCTLAICRDGRHPEVYRIPAMAGARILFQPSCSSDEVEAVVWKRTSGRAQLPAGPTTSIYHCVANMIGETPDGKQTSSGESFIREPRGLPLVQASSYREEMITAVLDLAQADRKYALDSLAEPPFLKPYWQKMIEEVRAHADDKPE